MLTGKAQEIRSVGYGCPLFYKLAYQITYLTSILRISYLSYATETKQLYSIFFVFRAFRMFIMMVFLGSGLLVQTSSEFRARLARFSGLAFPLGV